MAFLDSGWWEMSRKVVKVSGKKFLLRNKINTEVGAPVFSNENIISTFNQDYLDEVSSHIIRLGYLNDANTSIRRNHLRPGRL